MQALTHDLQLTDFEWELMLDLVRREHHELPHEIHHTRTNAIRGELRRRMDAIEQLEAKLEAHAGRGNIE